MIVTLLLLLAQPEGLPECDQEAAERGIQSDMNICAYRDYLIADEALNAQWRLTSDAMKQRDRSWAEYNTPPRSDDRPGYFETLINAQRAWITFRDAHCRSEGYVARGGSLEPLLVSTCKTALTEARTEQLRELAKTY